MTSHLLEIQFLGEHAVIGFFILSGYLMTYVMQNTYGYDRPLAFALNRALRLYPMHLLVTMGTLVILTTVGDATSFRRVMYIPSTFTEWAQNLSLIYLNWFPDRVSPRLSPPTWALTVELFFYALIALGLSKTRFTTFFWLVASCSYMVSAHIFDQVFAYRYYSILAGSFPFALGATLYHFRKEIGRLSDRFAADKYVALGLLVFIANIGLPLAFAETTLSAISVHFAFYANYAINFTLIAILMAWTSKRISRRADAFWGQLSYPLYLMHLQIGFMISMMVWGEPITGLDPVGLFAFAISLPTCLALSAIAAMAIDRPVQKYRAKISTARKA